MCRGVAGYKTSPTRYDNAVGSCYEILDMSLNVGHFMPKCSFTSAKIVYFCCRCKKKFTFAGIDLFGTHTKTKKSEIVEHGVVGAEPGKFACYYLGRFAIVARALKQA